MAFIAVRPEVRRPLPATAAIIEAAAVVVAAVVVVAALVVATARVIVLVVVKLFEIVREELDESTGTCALELIAVLAVAAADGACTAAALTLGLATPGREA